MCINDDELYGSEPNARCVSWMEKHNFICGQTGEIDI